MPLGKPCSISVIVPVLRESGGIRKLIAHLRALPADIDPEIIVVDGEPGGSTIRTIDRDDVITATSAPGRAVQMNHGASLASGSVLLFLHADTFLPVMAFERITTCMEKSRCAGGAFDIGFLTERRIFRVTERYVALRTRLTRIPFGDQAIFLRKEYFERIGGFKPIPLMEDIELMARIRKRGDRICILPEKVMTSVRRWEREGVLAATLRNWMLQLLYMLGVPPERLAKFYR